jgi:hypothetical protein
MGRGFGTEWTGFTGYRMFSGRSRRGLAEDLQGFGGLIFGEVHRRQPAHDGGASGHDEQAVSMSCAASQMEAGLPEALTASRAEMRLRPVQNRSSCRRRGCR